MRIPISLSVGFGLLLSVSNWWTNPVAAQGMVINEVDVDQSGSDAAEFVELYDGGAGNTSLEGLVLVFFNGTGGDGDASYRTVELDGHTTDANGMFVVGNPGVANVSIEIDPGNNGAIQNGPDAVALYMGSEADFPNGTAATSDNLVDAIVYGTDDGEAINLLDVLTPGQDQVNDTATESMARVPDGGTPRDTSTYVNQAPTPGVRNKADENLNLGISIAPESLSESSAIPAVVTITRSGPTAEAASILIAASDSTEVTITGTATFGSGEDSIAIDLQSVDDLWADGSQTVTISVTEVNNALNPADATIEILDDGDENQIVVNEVYPAVNNFTGDANMDDEIVNSLDEFVELVNVTDAVLDLSGFTLSDAVVVRHTFPGETLVDPGCAVLVFGGGNIQEGLLEEFGNALVQKGQDTGEGGVNEFGLGLNNAGDIVSIRNTAGIEVAGASWDSVSFDDGSLTRSPDTTGDFDFHPLVGFGSFSPGFDIDGNPFCESGLMLSVGIVPGTISEDAGPGAAILTVSRSGPLAEPLVVSLGNDDASEVAIPEEVTIPAGEASVNVDIDAVDDKAQDNTQIVTISANAPGYLVGRAEIQVADDGDEPVTVTINEFDADQEGTDTREFIELYDGGIGNLPLDGLLVVLFNGSNSQSYDTIDLNGQSTDSNGYLVLGSAEVPGVHFVVDGFQLQNGADGIAIYRDVANNFPNGTAPIEENLLDAVVYGTADDDAVDLLDILTPGKPQLNEGSSNNPDALARVPDGGPAFDINRFVAQSPTPGRSNDEAGDETGFALWALSFPGLGSPGDNNDSDPFNNTLEYALGFNPLENDDAGLLSYPTINAEGKLEFSLTKGEIAGADPNLTYIVEVSGNLTNWTTENTTVITETASTLAVTHSGDAGEIYMRLRVELQ